MKLYHYYLTLILCLSTVGAYAQEVPTFTAERTFYYQKGASTQALNARYSTQTIDALTSTFQAFSLVNLNSEALVNYVQKRGDASFVLKLDETLQVPIKLTPNSLLAEESALYELGPNGKVAVTKTPETVTFKGVVDAPGGGDVRFMMDKDQVQGFFIYNGEKTYLQALNSMVPTAGSQNFVVYQAEDVLEEGKLDCMALEAGKHERSLESQKTQAVCNGNWELEVATFATYSRYNDYNSIEAVNNEILGILNDVQSNYDEFNVKIKVVEQVVATCEGCEPWGNVSRSNLLDAFSSWGPSGFEKNHDEGILFYEGAGRGTIGTAWLSTICRNLRYAIVDRLNSAQANQVLVAHEMGHNFSAYHTSSGIMTPTINASSNFWASVSKNQINNFIDTRTCLSCVEGEGGGEPPVASCDQPDNLTATNLGETTIDLSWSPVAEAQNYNYRYRISGTSTWTSAQTSDNTVSLTGLTPDATYEWQINTVCGDANSAYKSGPGFKTLPSDGTPGNPDPTIPVAKDELPWLETFTLADGVSQDEGTTSWTTQVLNNFGGSVGVQDGRLAFNAVEAVWLSGKIDIADVSSFTLRYNYNGVSPSVMEEDDYIRIEYRLDEGAWEVLTERTDGTSGVSTPYHGRGGSDESVAQTLQLRITAKATASNETWYVDNIDFQCGNCAAVASNATSVVSVETKVYPNPTEGSFTVAVNTLDEKMDVRLIDLQGKEIFRKTEVDAQKPLTVSESLRNGLYILEVRGSSFSDRIKLVKN